MRNIRGKWLSFLVVNFFLNISKMVTVLLLIFLLVLTSAAFKHSRLDQPWSLEYICKKFTLDVYTIQMSTLYNCHSLGSLTLPLGGIIIQRKTKPPPPNPRVVLLSKEKSHHNNHHLRSYLISCLEQRMGQPKTIVGWYHYWCRCLY